VIEQGANPRKLPAASYLFQIEFRARYDGDDDDQQWETVAWALTRMDADDIATMRLTQHASTKHARIWYEGRVVAVYDQRCHPGTGRPGVSVAQIRDYLADTGWRREAGRTWVKDTERITLPLNDVDKPRVAKTVEQLTGIEGRSFTSITKAMQAATATGTR